MKISYTKNLIAIFVIVLAFVACDRNEEEPVANIVMATEKSCLSVNFWLWAYGTVVIDWGDGSGKETFDFSQDSISVPSHDYESEKAHTIKVYGENITRLSSEFFQGFSHVDISNATTLKECYLSFIPSLKSVNVGNSNTLTRLSCSGPFNSTISVNLGRLPELMLLRCNRAKITNLDISASTKLRVLDFPLCQFSDTELDAMFHLLPSYEPGMASMDITGNPGAGTCDISIAEKKGWLVYNL